MISLAACVLGSALLLTGCEGYGRIDQQVAIERSFWNPVELKSGNQPDAGLIGASRISDHGLLPDVRPTNHTGHYFFSIPADVTTVRKTTPTESEYLLYAGVLTNRLRPFLTILVTHRPVWTCTRYPAFRITEKRSYVLNNLAATQVSGYYHGKPFTELVLKRLASGSSVIDALAIVRNASERRLALHILDTMRWIPATHN